MNFNEFSSYLDKLEKTSSRLDMTEILADLFRRLDAKEIDKACYLLLGSLAPSFKGIVFNLAEKMMLRVLAKAYETDPDKVLSIYRKLGDIGETVVSLSSGLASIKKKTYSVDEVYEKLLVIAKDSGEDSQERKVEKTAKLLSELDTLSAKYLARIPVGKLRLGFSDKTILDALSWMETGGKSGKAKLEEAYNILPDVGLLAKEVKRKGIEKTSNEIMPELGIPVLPMLAARLKSPKEMIEKMKKVFVEPKFDGLRIQIHFKKSGFELTPLEIEREQDKKVKAFTRNLNECSWMFPELKNLAGYVKADELILDSEAVGVDSERKTMANFQTTMSRRRKHDIAELSKKVSIKFNVFDIMYLNGKGVANLPYTERRKLLSESVKSGNLINIVDYEITNDPKVINAWMEKELGEGLEGVLVKRADSKYIAGRTGYRWVKMKEKESQAAKLADTMDLVIMGFSAGKGKRASFGVGQFLVGVRKDEEFKTVTKIGTGLSDEQFKELNIRLSDLVVTNKPKEYEVNKIQEPNYWVEPKVVVEIAADEVTKSPTHTSGYALRFPRLIKFRDDKDPGQVTTLNELLKLFHLQ